MIRAFEEVEVCSRSEWRAWLAANWRRPESVWVVTWRKGAGPHVPYGDIRDEALCFGWIDSLPRKRDDGRTMLLLSPRRPGSAWSAVNKARVEVLEAEGRLAEGGRAAIARAQEGDAWTRLDGANSGALPTDLIAALEAAAARAVFEGFAPSSRRGILEWIAQARQAQTRARRVAETARLAALGLRANHPESKGR